MKTSAPNASQIGPGDPRSVVREEGEDPDHEGERRSDQRRDGHLGAADAHVARGAVRALEIRLREAEPHDRDLRGGERDQDAEAVQAREEPHRVVRRPWRPGGSRPRSRPVEMIVAGEISVLRFEAPERPREHVVPAERVGEPSGARERGRDHGDEDHDAGQADEHAQDVDDSVWQVAR